jgi:hypothetical protein
MDGLQSTYSELGTKFALSYWTDKYNTRVSCSFAGLEYIELCGSFKTECKFFALSLTAVSVGAQLIQVQIMLQACLLHRTAAEPPHPTSRDILQVRSKKPTPRRTNIPMRFIISILIYVTRRFIAVITKFRHQNRSRDRLIRSQLTDSNALRPVYYYYYYHHQQHYFLSTLQLSIGMLL